MRLVHTSDWHLGHSLHDRSRAAEHDAFLSWLLDVLAERRADALLIAGDVFDVANPSAEAQRQWYGFLSRARARLPQLDIVVIAGNHDSAVRLEAPEELLRSMNVRLVGRLPRTEERAVDAAEVWCPLRDARGNIAAWCAAVPFLRPSDLPRVETDEQVRDDLVEGVRRVYQDVLNHADPRMQPQHARLAMGHCYMSSKQLAQLSERKILGGNQHALPADIFPEGLAYVALGHLHLAQTVGGREGVRYAGSPIPLSVGEVGYPHQVVLVELEGAALHSVTPLSVPRTVQILRVPAEGPGELDAVLAELAALPTRGMGEGAAKLGPLFVGPTGPPPYLEVRVRLAQPELGLRRRVVEAVADKHVDLVKLSVEYAGRGEGLVDALPERRLADLDVEEVFAQLHQSVHGSDPDDDLVACFRELVDEVQQRVEEGSA
ncbi:MAG: exonuclease SbcCD subunit D C-terminal domain-containing protein [Myxococcales bacterium]|nr:exonuclease SbcCD subunit D C-terminal domain-containing protein [Myxococcales bacterium]